MVKPTLKDVAAASGFSIATVAFILRGHPKSFPDATRDKVVAAAKRLGYRANASARATRNGRMGAFALVQIEEDLHGDMAWSTLDGVIAAVESGGDHLIITKLPGSAFADPGRMPKILHELVVDGLLLSYHTAAPENLASAIRSLQVPAVWINSRLAHDCVHLDDLDAARRVIDHLYSAGHRRIAYVNFWQASGRSAANQHYSMIDRLAGYRQAMRAHGLASIELAADESAGSLERRSCELLAGPERPSAVVLYHANFATPFLIAAARVGLAVPEDMSLVTFSDRQDVIGGIRIEAAHGDYAAMGRGAVEMLRRSIAHPGRSQPAQAVSCHWYSGDTVASLRI